jgi:hypothetical protein
MEHAPKRKKEREESGPSALTRTLLSAVAAIGVLSMPDHKQLTSAEIGTLENWFDGARKLKHAAQKPGPEVATIFARLDGGVSAWLPVTVGTETSVDRNIKEDVIAPLKKAITDGNATKVETVCTIHTHPPQSLSVSGRRAAAEGKHQLYPPSQTDLANSSVRFLAPGLRDARVVSAVFAGQGVFYYRPASAFWGDYTQVIPEERAQEVALETQAKKEAPVLRRELEQLSVEQLFSHYTQTLKGLLDGRPLEEVRKEYKSEEQLKQDLGGVIIEAIAKGDATEVVESLLLGKESFTSIRKLHALKLEREAYSIEVRNRFIAATSQGEKPSPDLARELEKAMAFEGYRIRYVPYEDLAKEPPCAGVDYKAK